MLSSVSESVGMAEFQVALATPSAQVVTVKYAVTGGTATGGGADFTLSNGTVTFKANETVQTVRFPIVNDTRDEADETIQITLSAPSNATLANSSSTLLNITILDDDATPSVGFQTIASSGNESVVAPKLNVVLSAASGQTVTVPYSVSGGTATGGGVDFTLTNGTVTFAPGQTTQTIALAVINDLRHEEAETIAVALGTPSNATRGSIGTHTYTIQDNDPASTLPDVNFVSASATATEPSARTTINLPAVQLSAAPAAGKNVTVKYAVSGGSAISGSDFTLAAGTLTFTSTGSLTQTIPISLLPDTLDEANETVQVTLSAPSNAQLGTLTTTTLTLQDDTDAAPQVGFQLAASAIKEAVKTSTLNVTLSAASGQTVSVPYSVTAGTATGGGIDFTLASGTLTFAPGKTTATIPLTVVNDTLHELNETVLVTLGTPTNGTLGANVVHTITIQDDDAVPKVSFKAVTSSVSEKLGLVVIPVVLSAATSETVTINYAVLTGGTASSADFVLSAGTLTFAPGETTKNISLTAVDDGVTTPKEPSETVKISLTSPSGATLATAVHTATITDGGTLPSVKFVAATSTASEAIGTTNVAVSLSAPTSKTVTVNYSTTGTATAADFTLPSNSITFLPGETTKNIAINIVDDKLIDPKETILLTLAVPLNATLGPTKLHTLTVQDNDPLDAVQFQATDRANRVSTVTNFGFTLDSTAPTASSDAQGLLSQSITEIALNFSEGMATSAFLVGGYQLTTLDGQTIPISSVTELGANHGSVVLHLSSALLDGDYQLTLQPSVSDLAGNAVVQGRQSTFTIHDLAAMQVTLSSCPFGKSSRV